MFQIGFGSFALASIIMLVCLALTVWQLLRKQPEISGTVRFLTNLGFGLHTLSILALLYMQITQDYSNAYVVGVINPALPTYLRVTALWGGQAGSLFFWSWIINLCLVIALNRRHILQDNWGYLFTLLNLIFFSGISMFLENPFNRVWRLADGSLTDSLFSPAAVAQVYSGLIGQGLNPLLRHWGMIIHPPVLYIGFGAFLLPFAETLSHLVVKGDGEDLIARLRPWLLVAWIFLTAGIALGSWWSYDVLGWGGYWAWDPVETSSLIPWLISTALLHSMFLQQKKDIFKRINVILILASYLLILFSILMTRAGLISSVHAFGESSISVPLTAFLLVFLVVSVTLVAWRWKKMDSGWEFQSWFSRDSLFLYSLVLLVAIAFVCMWGLLYPLASRAFTGTEITLDRGFYDRAVTPLLVMLVLLMAVCPLVGWSVANLKKLGKRYIIPLIVAVLATIAASIWLSKSWVALLSIFIVALGLAVLTAVTARDLSKVEKPLATFWKMRSRYGAFLVHTGILLIMLGIVGVEGLSDSIQGTMVPGDKMPLGEYAVEYLELTETYDSPEYLSVRAELDLWRGDEIIGRLTPGQDVYESRSQYVSIPGKRSTLAGDFYTIMLAYDSAMGYVSIQATINPLVNWMWIGSFLLCLGAAFSLSSPIVREQAFGNSDEREEDEELEAD
ncbi:MAG: cytochrome c-type biogenesis CcmF C-terminal domain-containing protein [Anaerolineaceae bacterium]|nr:cytochrome c-type biogenesis CcmF C-terminal domain-containing protein [Anaerolineaceae bacterium]